MPNRKTFDPSERYDHSGRSVGHAEKNDLKPDVGEHAPKVDGTGSSSPAADRAKSGHSPSPRKAGTRGDKQGPPAER
jgi:hypothetical protein